MSTFLGNVSAEKTAIHTAVTTKTAAASISPNDTGGNMELICDLLTALNINNNLSNTLYSTYDLELGATLGSGNRVRVNQSTPNVNALGGTYNTYLSDSLIACILNAGSVVQLTLGMTSSKATLKLLDSSGSGKFGFLQSGTLTADRKVLFPDEGDGVGLDATLVTHTTKDIITVGDPTNIHTNYGNDFVLVYDTDSTTVVAKLQGAGSFGLLQLKDVGSAYYISIKAGTLTGSRTIISPDHDGTIATNDGGSYNSGSVTGVSVVTVTHGLSFTPTRIFITPSDSTAGAALVGYWIVPSEINGTDFKVHFPVFTGTLKFDWQAF